MTKKDNFNWLTDDINNTLVLQVIYKRDNKAEFYGVFNISDVLETPCDELEVDTGNINDLTNLLTLGIVRFVNINDNNRSDIIEIPFKKLYLLYRNACRLPGVKIPFSELDVSLPEFNISDYNEGNLIPFNELDTFSVIDGTVRNDFLLLSAVVSDVSVDLVSLMEIAYEFGNYGMQEKFDALKKVDLINHRRMLNDKREKTL